MHKEINNGAAEFYDDISGNYDEMFNFEKDLDSAEKFVAKLKEQFDFDTALDIGCGTGRFPIALTRSGVKAAGMDLSGSMIEAAKKNSHAYGLDIDFINSGMNEMLSNVDGKFDLIMCMGNTLPHLLNKKDLSSMMTACRQLLNPSGHLILNFLNYDKVLGAKERIIGITRSENYEFIRFYDFEPPYVNFNLLEIDWSKRAPAHKLVSTKLYPYTRLDVESALIQTGFEDLTVYGGLSFDKYKPEKSKSITLIASS
ncbi:MAG: class I SAM-dependent methyltransferase [Victivallaceae bacterium]|nr:class I SAM-dependent methyltransferase [Victivallaceae bacterium]